MKAFIYNVIVWLNRRTASLTQKLSQPQFFLMRIIYAFMLFITYVFSAAAHAIGIVFLSSATSFQYFHELQPEKGYDASFSQYNHWRKRIQISAISSTIVIIIVTILNGLFLAQEQGDAANFTINCSGTAGSPTAVSESSFIDGDVLTFTDAGGDGYCQLDEALDVGTTGSVTIESGVILTHPAEDVDGVDITANTVVITGDIIVDAKGCRGGSGADGDGYGPDTSSGNVCTISTAGFGDGVGAGGTDSPGGASHGGSGGASSDSVTAANYGEADDPALLGSGGGSNGTEDGGAGGGLVLITTPYDTGTITVNGSITADGAAGGGSTSDAGAGGSGGAIHLTTGFLSGNGTVSTDAGDGGTASTTTDRSGAGGGGGRVAFSIVNDTLTANGTVTSAASFAGSVSANPGNQGTVTTNNYGPPNTPTNTAPSDGQDEVSKTPTLTTSTYVDDDGGTHTTSDWWVYSNNDCTEPRDDGLSQLGSATYLASYTIPGGSELAPHADYSFVVRYTDELSLDSGFSECTSFATVNATPVASIGSLGGSVSEDSSSVELDASGSSDDDSDTLSYSWSETADTENGCSIDGSSTNSTVDVTVANLDSSYSCDYQVEADDGYGGTDTESITVNVDADNDAPTVASIADQTAEAGDEVSFAAAASDPDSSSLTLSASDNDGSFAAAGVTVASLFNDIGDGSGQFTWDTDGIEPGTYLVDVSVSDGNSSDSETVTITITQGSSGSGDLSFTGSLPSVSFAAGTTTNTVFDLDDYFSSDEALTYTSSGEERVTVNIASSGEVSFSAPASYVGSERITFTATENESNESLNSNTIVVSVTETLGGPSDVDYVTGKSKGQGVVTVYDKQNEILAQWPAYQKGGVVPRLVFSGDESYVITVKRRSGSTAHVYTSQGTILKKRRLSPKLHFRKLATGELNDKPGSIEMVVATKRGSTIYFRIFSYQTGKNRIVLKKRAKYRPIKGKNYRVNIQKKRVKMVNKNGKTKFIWTPFE